MKKLSLDSKLAVVTETATALMKEELDLSGLLELILDRVRTLFGVDRCAILLCEERTGTLNMLKAVGYSDDVSRDFSLKIGEGISGWVASSGMPAFVEDVSTDARYVPGVDGALSEVAVPLKRNDTVVGVLDIETKEKVSRQDFDMDLLTVFASQCANALHNASLVRRLQGKTEQLEARVRELQVLNHVGKLLGRILPLKQVLSEILRLANEVFRFKACAVLLADPSDLSVLTVKAAVGYPEEALDSLTIKRGEGITGEVYRTGIPRLVDDVTLDPAYIPGIIGGRCEMACPLVARGKVLGVLDAEGESPGCFDEQKFVLFSTFASQAAVAIRNAQMLERTQSTYYQTISSLANALEARDSYTRGHSERVTALAMRIGGRMGLGRRDMGIIRESGLLHDIGKIGVPDGVLNKPSSLSSAEREEIEHHPLFGNNILGQLKFLQEASKAILHHHERFDGQGYPAGLLGQEIPLVARIIAVADAWDAMTSSRPYRNALERQAALDELAQHAGAQFDPAVVKAFMDILGEESPPTGPGSDHDEGGEG